MSEPSSSPDKLSRVQSSQDRKSLYSSQQARARKDGYYGSFKPYAENNGENTRRNRLSGTQDSQGTGKESSLEVTAKPSTPVSRVQPPSIQQYNNNSRNPTDSQQTDNSYQEKRKDTADDPYQPFYTPQNPVSADIPQLVHAPRYNHLRSARQDSVSETKPEAPRRLLGIAEHQTAYTGNRNYDYTQKYSPDEFGQEASENARVWKVYLDEAEAFDDEMLKGFRDTLDALLVFAALFSGVVTTLVTSTVDSLQPNYAQITARLMLEQNQLLRAAGNATAVNLVQSQSVDLDNADVSANDLWINGLFFASLSLSLVTALLSVLVKQWLRAYASLPNGNAMERSKIRQFRYQGFLKWRVPQIIGALPLVLHASLALFMVGLSIYVSELHRTLCWVVVAVTAFSFLMYLGSVFLPAVEIQCPYRIPVLFAPINFLLSPFKIVKYYWQKVRYRFHHVGRAGGTVPQWPSFDITSFRDTEILFLEPDYAGHNHRPLPSCTRHHSTLADSLRWLQSLKSNNSIQKVVAQALHGIFQENMADDEDDMKIIHQPALQCYGETLDLKFITNLMWNTLIHFNLDRDSGDAIALYDHKLCSSLCVLWEQMDGWFPPMLPKYSIYEAASNGYLDLVKVLVRAGADVNIQGGQYGYPLQAAAYWGHLGTVKYLVEQGADIHADGGKYGFALHAAAIGKHLGIVEYLVEQGADVNAQGGKFGSALQAAVIGGPLEIIKYLVEKEINGNGFAVQPASAMGGNLDIVKYLVEKGADVGSRGGRYGSPIQAAAFQGDLDIVKYLVGRGVDVNVQGGKYGSPLEIAQQRRFTKIVQYLQGRGAEELSCS